MLSSGSVVHSDDALPALLTTASIPTFLPAASRSRICRTPPRFPRILEGPPTAAPIRVVEMVIRTIFRLFPSKTVDAAFLIILSSPEQQGATAHGNHVIALLTFGRCACSQRGQRRGLRGSIGVHHQRSRELCSLSPLDQTLLFSRISHGTLSYAPG